MDREEKIDFEKRLTEVTRRGIPLYLNGRLSSPKEIVRVHEIHEDRIYMPDYVLDDKGGLREVHYDRIKI